MSEPPIKPPITVQANVAPVVTSESAKLIAVAGFALAADHFMHSETAIIAVMAASGAILTVFWAVWHRVRTWGALRFLADRAPDHIATVGKPK